MTPTLETQTQVSLAFDSLAERYDEIFTRTMIGRAQRRAVWNVLTQAFQPGARILELNCGTGEDAFFLARRQISIVACDASERMIQTARRRKEAKTPNAPIQFKVLPTERLRELESETLFDGAFSNFSGLNCVADLNHTARDLASLVAIHAPVLICLSTRFCVAETLWFILRGKFRKAFRRTSGHATANLAGFSVKVHYPTLREVRKLFSPFFLMRSCTGIGVAVPPSYLEPWIRKCPRLLNLLRAIDRDISRLPWFRTIGDHMLIYFERVDA